MKAAIFVLLFSISTTFAMGQYNCEQPKYSDTLLKVKNVLEKHLVGTNIRDLRTYFTIDKTQSSSSYKIKGDVISMLPSSQLKLIHHKLNRALKKYVDLKLDGNIYFDKYTDSTLVSLGYLRTDTIYCFSQTPIPLDPREGYANFSKELHDVIRLKIKQGKISKGSILSINEITFNVNLSGVINRNDNEHFKNELDSFFNAKRWKRSAFGSYFVESQVKFALNHNYLIKDSEWHKPYLTSNGNNYGDGLANLDLLTPFRIGLQPTFYSHLKPTKTHNYKSLISILYDPVLNKYLMPIVHFGNVEWAKQLIEDLKKLSISNRYFFKYGRVYLYRTK